MPTQLPDAMMSTTADQPLECLSVGILVADHLCDPIDHVPAAGELVLSGRLPLATGGCAANAGVDLARLGVKVGVVGCVGHDAFGRFMIDELTAAGVDTRHIHQLPGEETSGTLIINVRGEDRRFVHCVGANARVQVSDIPRAEMLRAKVLYVGGYLLMPALEGAPLAALFREARAAGVKTVLDIVLPGPGNHWPKLESVLAETDVFLPNTDESKVLTGETDPLRQAEKFASAGAGAVVITCGENGSVIVSGKERLRAGTYPVEYHGGTGSGDAFDAGFITGMLLGGDLVECVRWGSAIGASCVRSISATDSVFTRSEAEAFLAEHTLAIERV
jgi:sugar/nucleoside kinase (ribokinase family)